MADLKAAFRAYLSDELQRQESTVDAYLYRLRWLEKRFDKRAREITSDDLRALKKTGLAEETVKSFIVAAHQFHDWGALEGHWERNGISLVRTPRTYPTLPEPLSLDQVALLKAACRRPLEYRLVYVGLYTGTRIGETAALHGSMWEGDWLRFRGEKTQRMREVPVHPHLQAVKWEVLGNPPTDPDTMQRIKRRLARRVGFHFVANQLRDTFTTRLYDLGVDDRIVKELIGHTTGVTGRYLEVSRRRKREAMERLSYEEAQHG